MAKFTVAVRVRPLLEKELLFFPNHLAVKYIDEQSILIQNVELRKNNPFADSRKRSKRFKFDKIMWSVDPTQPYFSDQEQVYNQMRDVTMVPLTNGYNVCLFTYGQTGSGKTYTMMGTQEEPGFVPRLCQDLFKHLENKQISEKIEKKFDYNILVSFMEIYNEKVYDLLQIGSKNIGINSSKAVKELRVREHPKSGPFVEGLTMVEVKSKEEIKPLLERGNIARKTASNGVHKESSRSHAIFTITLKQAKLDESHPLERCSSINLVDLAGSEKAGSSSLTISFNSDCCQSYSFSDNQENKIRLKEGSLINRSLSTLTSVIQALAQSLEGNAYSAMIATLSPSSSSYFESMNTLSYGQKASCIINEPVINENPETKLINNLKAEISRLKKLLFEQRIETQNSKRDVFISNEIPQIESCNCKIKEKYIFNNQVTPNLKKTVFNDQDKNKIDLEKNKNSLNNRKKNEVDQEEKSMEYLIMLFENNQETNHEDRKKTIRKIYKDFSKMNSSSKPLRSSASQQSQPEKVSKVSSFSRLVNPQASVQELLIEKINDDKLKVGELTKRFIEKWKMRNERTLIEEREQNIYLYENEWIENFKHFNKQNMNNECKLYSPISQSKTNITSLHSSTIGTNTVENFKTTSDIESLTEPFFSKSSISSTIMFEKRKFLVQTLPTDSNQVLNERFLDNNEKNLELKDILRGNKNFMNKIYPTQTKRLSPIGTESVKETKNKLKCYLKENVINSRDKIREDSLKDVNKISSCDETCENYLCSDDSLEDLKISPLMDHIFDLEKTKNNKFVENPIFKNDEKIKKYIFDRKQNFKKYSSYEKMKVDLNNKNCHEDFLSQTFPFFNFYLPSSSVSSSEYGFYNLNLHSPIFNHSNSIENSNQNGSKNYGKSDILSLDVFPNSYEQNSKINSFSSPDIQNEKNNFIEYFGVQPISNWQKIVSNNFHKTFQSLNNLNTSSLFISFSPFTTINEFDSSTFTKKKINFSVNKPTRSVSFESIFFCKSSKMKTKFLKKDESFLNFSYKKKIFPSFSEPIDINTNITFSDYRFFSKSFDKSIKKEKINKNIQDLKRVKCIQTNNFPVYQDYSSLENLIPNFKKLPVSSFRLQNNNFLFKENKKNSNDSSSSILNLKSDSSLSIDSITLVLEEPNADDLKLEDPLLHFSENCSSCIKPLNSSKEDFHSTNRFQKIILLRYPKSEENLYYFFTQEDDFTNFLKKFSFGSNSNEINLLKTNNLFEKSSLGYEKLKKAKEVPSTAWTDKEDRMSTDKRSKDCHKNKTLKKINQTCRHKKCFVNEKQDFKREVQKIRKERKEIVKMLNGELNENKVQIDILEAQLNYNMGKTDMMVQILKENESSGHIISDAKKISFNNLDDKNEKNIQNFEIMKKANKDGRLEKKLEEHIETKFITTKTSSCNEFEYLKHNSKNQVFLPKPLSPHNSFSILLNNKDIRESHFHSNPKLTFRKISQSNNHRIPSKSLEFSDKSRSQEVSSLLRECLKTRLKAQKVLEGEKKNQSWY